MMTNSVFQWWAMLCAVTAFNVLAWSAAATALVKRRPSLSGQIYANRRLQMLLSAGYVLGCGFRSIFPVYDIPRICLFDTFISSAIVGRSVATFAELCFAAQWALLLREMAAAHNSGGALRASSYVVPLIALAEVFSWYSVLTTSNIGHVFEETLWGATAALLVVSMLFLWRRCDAALRPMLALWCAAGVGYVLYMFLADVPMYWARWLDDEASGRTYMTVLQGAIDAAGRRVVSHNWHDWSNEVVWMSLYFSVAVWLSIALMHAPAMSGAGTKSAESSRRLAAISKRSLLGAD
jgi:hypothetical protein